MNTRIVMRKQVNSPRLSATLNVDYDLADDQLIAFTQQYTQTDLDSEGVFDYSTNLSQDDTTMDMDAFDSNETSCDLRNHPWFHTKRK